MKPPLKERSPVLRFLQHAHQNGLKAAMRFEAGLSRRSWAYVLGVVKGWFSVLFRWFFSWRIQRRLWIGAASLATLLALFYAVENWRGQRAWEHYRQAVEAEGKSFNYEDYLPPPVPDEENLAMAPIFRPLLEYRANSGSLEWEDPEGYARATEVRPYWRKANYRTKPTLGQWLKAEPCDLREWQFYYRGPTNLPAGSFPEAWVEKHAAVKREPAEGMNHDFKFTVDPFPISPEPRSPAQDVLLALTLFDDELTEIAEAAAQRPLARWPVHYEYGFGALLTHLSSLRGTSETLLLRAIAQLEQGNAERAMADLDLCWALAESLESEPYFISTRFRQGLVRVSLQVIWEGQRRHLWDEPQLNNFVTRLDRFEFARQHERGLRMERAMAYQMFSSLWVPSTETSWNNFRTVLHIPAGSDRALLLDWWLRLAPRGWGYHNMIAWDRVLTGFTPDYFMDDSLSKETVRFSDLLPGSIVLVPAHFIGYDIQRVFQPRGEDPSLPTVHLSVRLARTACALELHRLRHGEYPDSLTALVADFLNELPPDEFADEPLHYRRTATDEFALWSVGSNRTDEGGAPGENLLEGDWAWRIEKP
jgi:hypothetical protein